MRKEMTMTRNTVEHFLTLCEVRGLMQKFPMNLQEKDNKRVHNVFQDI